jgi:hypothetical protein
VPLEVPPPCAITARLVPVEEGRYGITADLAKELIDDVSEGECGY